MYLIFDGSIENLEVLFSKSAILVYIGDFLVAV